MSLPDHSKNLFLTKFNAFGKDKFYEFLVNYGDSRAQHFDKKTVSAADELLEYYEKFLISYRKEKNTVYLDIARLFRKAAHLTYRKMLKNGLIKYNLKFLNLVEIKEK